MTRHILLLGWMIFLAAVSSTLPQETERPKTSKADTTASLTGQNFLRRVGRW